MQPTSTTPAPAHRARGPRPFSFLDVVERVGRTAWIARRAVTAGGLLGVLAIPGSGSPRSISPSRAQPGAVGDGFFTCAGVPTLS